MKRDILAKGERRWTAVLCADLVDFTGLSRKLGPERTYEMLSDVIALVRVEIEAVGGSIIEYAGDAVFAVFGAPKAVENASLDACRAALAIQSQMARHEMRLQRSFGVAPKFRIGLAGGSVVFGSLGHGEGLDINVLGDAVNLSMRLQKMTEKGTVVCSDTIFEQVEGFVVVGEPREMSVRGLQGTHKLHQITGLLDSVTEFQGRMRRGAGVFLGRQPELDILSNWLAEPSPEHPMIDVSGPPGVGKSRLTFEFITTLDQSWTVYIGQCNHNTQQTTLVPILEVIREAIGYSKGMNEKAIEAKLNELIPDETAGVDYLTRLIGGFDRKDGDQETDGALNARKLCQLVLLELATRNKTIFLIEDVHWLDSVSEAILNALITLPERTNLRIIATRRAHIPCIWNTNGTAAEMQIGPLDKGQVKTLIATLVKTTDVSGDLLTLISEKSENNPLFVEEIVRYLQFAKGIATDGDIASLVPGDYGNIVSGNLQHLVLSRFDALPSSDKELLVIASAKGRQFSDRFLSLADPNGSDIIGCIKRALEAGLIEQDPSGSDQDWRFSHALIGDAIYQNLLGTKRKDVHQRIAETLENNAGNALHLSYEELAVHYQAAGNTQKAVHYLWRSAAQAFEVFSVVHADAQLNAAFDLIENEPDLVSEDTFGEMLFLWCRTLDIFANYRKLTLIVKHHLPRLSAQGTSEALALCTAMHALARCHAADFAHAHFLCTQSLEMAEELELEGPLLWAKVVKMRVNVDGGYGSLEETVALYDEIKPAAEKLADSHLIQLSTYVVMTAHRSTGALREANNYVDWLTNYGEVNKSTRARAMASWARCLNHLVREEMDEAIVAADENLRYTIPPTGDWRVASVGKVVAKLLRGDPDVPDDALEPYLSATQAFADASLGNAVRSQHCIQLLTRGKIHVGWNLLLKTQKEIDNAVSPEMKRFFELVKGEFLLAVAGLIPSNGPRPKLGVLDIFTLIRLRIGAKKNAAKAMDNFLSMIPVRTGYFVARVKRNLALIARSNGDTEKAKALFDESVRLYEAEEMFEAAKAVNKLRHG